MDRYAVFGNPIGHSKSPLIHQMFAQQTGETLSYEAICAPLDGFAASVTTFFSAGLGANVTVPFKEQAWELTVQRSERAEMAGAVNTLLLNEHGEICGDNTDGVGLVTDLVSNHHVQLQGKRVLVLGAGGAVRGILGPLLAQQPLHVVVANRTVEKAEALATLFAQQGAISACGFADITGEFDVIINGTAASLQGEMPPLPAGLVAAHTVCYDMMYSAEPTVFNLWAQRQSAARQIDGLGMLVEQAAEAFFVWRGKRPDTGPVLQQLRADL